MLTWKAVTLTIGYVDLLRLSKVGLALTLKAVHKRLDKLNQMVNKVFTKKSHAI